MKVWGIVLIVMVCSLCLSEQEEKSITGEKEPEESTAKTITETETPEKNIAKTITETKVSESFMDIEKARELLGETVSIKGVVTAPPGIFRDDVMYIQDSTAGIKVYSRVLNDLDIKLGDVVRIEGVIDRYYENIEIKFLKTEKISILGNETPYSLSLSIKEAKNREGSFIAIEGTVTKVYRNKFFIRDESDEIIVYIDKDTGISISVKTGDRVKISGVISQYKEDIEILPRYDEDIQLID
ncbi:MAG: hypothetical protein DRM98_06375 [Thermoplasmata archaeon]|nr:MAG: hypothetical protein DRM98_06375 [Thermoplasmata archaeon]RLF92749.1 MAG: hypothetical protein DRN45_06740 [Thermococci archaeon]